MKFTKPTYDAKQRIYTCDVADGFRFSVRRECGSFVKDPASCIDSDERIAHLIKSTQGWFSKPLTEEFLKGKIQYDIPTNVPKQVGCKPLASFADPLASFADPLASFAENFEGLVEWQIQRLIISKEQFLFVCVIVNTVEDEKVSLEFPEEHEPEAKEPEEEIPLHEETPLGIGPTRRSLEKEKVLSARAKAARALFHAERLTQEFYQNFGETDWEDEE
jgi:hypothetical protein